MCIIFLCPFPQIAHLNIIDFPMKFRFIFRRH